MFKWKEVNRGEIFESCSFEQDGFTIVLSVVTDNDHDFTRGRGRFTDTYETGAIRNPRANHDPKYYRYFIPEQSVESVAKYYREEEHMSALQAAARALKQAKDDLAIAADPEAENYQAFGVTCEVKKVITRKLPKGDIEQNIITIGEASLWGIELCYKEWNAREENHKYLDQIAEEELKEALANARANLAELRK